MFVAIVNEPAPPPPLPKIQEVVIRLTAQEARELTATLSRTTYKSYLAVEYQLVQALAVLR